MHGDFKCVALLFYYRWFGDYSTQIMMIRCPPFSMTAGPLFAVENPCPWYPGKFLVCDFLFFICLDLLHNSNRRGLDHVVVFHHGQDVSVVALAGRYNAGTAMG
jgi:hypothetical protein